MATNACDSRRKHHRSSSPEEMEKSSKRHKHRHHSHRHRHGSKKREAEIEYDEGTVAAVPSPTPPPNLRPHSHLPDDDVEEGEILEDEAFDGEVGKKQTESDVEPGEIKVTGDRDARSDNRIQERFTKKNSEARDKDISSDDGSPNHGARPKDGKNARASTDGVGNGYLDPRSSKGDKWQNGELGHFKGNKKLKGDFDDKTLEANSRTVCYQRNSSSESGGEKYRMLGNSPSHDRYRSRSRSTGHTRDRSRSRSIVEEYAHSKRKHSGDQGSLYYTGRHKTDYDHDEEKVRAHGREHGHGNIDLVVDDRRDYSTRYLSREARDRDRSRESRDRDVDRDLYRERRQEETSRGKEIEWERKRVKESDRSHERYRRDVENDRSREREDDRDRRREKEREMVFERDRRREKERDRSRDRTRGSERDRDLENERVGKNRGRDNIKERERRDDRYKYKDRDTSNGKDRHLRHEDGNENGDKYRKHSRHEENEYHRERKRNSDNPPKFYNSMGSTMEEDASKLTSEVEPDDLEEDTLHLPEQEEEDLNRIKEESRRRREAIMEKYKKQHQQVEQEVGNEGKDKDTGIPTNISEARDGKKGVDYEEPSFAVGKSPENVNVASKKISGAGGLGEGTPKSERSDDKFCDDIFGETPTGVRKSGKGDGLLIERVDLHDNWDDAEGYYSYRFGEILDGRYEVTAAHGRGVFSTVVRAKNLKIGNGEPEEVAIKIIRNNDTMYKAGMDELVILKKLVGADPDDKRHCVRFLSSFRYRNHLCLVFESLNMNLREVLKKFGRNIGLRLTAVRAYAKQLFIALKHLRNCGVLHCDIKPDNMLVNEAKNVLKLCDFGNAMFAGKNEVTPYLVSRFYRAPEIILGLPYDHPLDIWSVGCCLYELHTGKVLFPGLTNNDMLRLQMELKGPFPKKMLRKGAFTEQHFDQDLNFLATEEDPVTKKTIKRLILNIKPKDIGTLITGSPGEDPKMLSNFKDLLEKVFVLDPDKRLTVSQALNHPFITGK
ncbi:serine/threonine-protein kinase prpf4B-like isoform X2 [Abrus precatorius]|uniref:Serine/threonine-protein kinase PRP4 homolog n=1 Tax=Abrus precatorius TaxID=3816 RepID=A0A8B8MEF3_ABRPR|nr:serine/threonine-protein kinase prpf4B-like isoform X2 [Abrus precatorius]XP_027366173.1 serine/threonine-protein kinase prpf4B-like isoform X2 [Abrus precatorius]